MLHKIPTSTETKRELRITWNQNRITLTKITQYLGATLAKTLNFKEHIDKTRRNVDTRKNLLQKLT